MKIQELLEDGLLPPSTTITTSTLVEPSSEYDIDAAYREYDPERAGLYSMGKSDPDDPHIFHKKGITPMPGKIDAMYAYYQAIEGIKGDNPWLPVVYTTQVTQDPTSEKKLHLPDYRMERLYDIEDVGYDPRINDPNVDADDNHKNKQFLPPGLTYNSIQNIIDQESADRTIVTLLKTISWYKQNKTYPKEARIRLISDIYMKILLYIVKGGIRNPARVNDPHLKQACEIIKKLLEQNSKFVLDLHDGNILFRKTSVGIQPVIVDPLSSLRK